tara:strand:- start:324 stop:542 length:219 start_codon:yes stop_codon:yes gene_type:complete
MGKMKELFIEQREEELEKAFIENQYKSNILFTSTEHDILINLIDKKIKELDLYPMLLSELENLKIKINLNTR